MTEPLQFLTPDESAEVDKALLTARDRFSTRVAIYALRSLKKIAEETGVTIAELQPHQILDWVSRDPTLDAQDGVDRNFKQFFSQLVISSLKPLKQAALENNVTIESLSLAQVIAWFEKEGKIRQEQGPEATFLKR